MEQKKRNASPHHGRNTEADDIGGAKVAIPHNQRCKCCASQHGNQIIENAITVAQKWSRVQEKRIIAQTTKKYV